MRVKLVVTWMLFLGMGVLLGWILFRPSTAHALPEYAERTGASCGTCHVNPAGGGARTQQGMLWVVAGKPDVVPTLPAGAQPIRKPRPVPVSGPAALYVNFECGDCHGMDGSGGFGPPLNTGELTPEDIVDYVRYGSGAMPAFDGDELSDQQLDQLVGYIQGLAAGLAGVPREALICGQ